MKYRSAVQVKELPPEVQAQVLNLHHQTFSDSACKSCPGNCCVLCGSHDGYFSGRMPDAELDKLKKTYGFTKKDGFKGETGCKLPITERNDICLSYMCSGIAGSGSWAPPVSKPFTKEDRERGYEIQNAFWQKEDATPEGTPGKTRLAQLWPSRTSPSNDAGN